jgi:hypothetical protein
VPAAGRARLAGVRAAPWVVAFVAAASVAWATRGDPRLSPDSITYLTVADHLRSGKGLTDFTGDPLTIFPPVYPLLLVPGGRSLLWVRIVSSAIAGGGAVLALRLLRHRVRFVVSVIAAVAFWSSRGIVMIGSSTWSELPYIVISLAMFVVLAGSDRLTGRRCALAGALAGAAFLTRYAGAGTIAAGLAMVAAMEWNAGGRAAWKVAARRVSEFGLAALGVCSVWVVHNLVVVGQPLGPRFEGGTNDEFSELIRRPFRSIGWLVLGDDLSRSDARVLGLVVCGVSLVCIAWIVRQRSRRGARGRLHHIDVGMVVFGTSAIVLPVLARMATSNDISPRVMSPVLLPVVALIAVAIDESWPREATEPGEPTEPERDERVTAAPSAPIERRARRPIPVLLTALAAGVAVATMLQGARYAAAFPDLPSSGSRRLYSPGLFDAVDALDPDATVISNNPWSIAWVNERDPSLFGFVVPRAGNSHYPISAERTLELACAGPTYLAWFPTFLKAGDVPRERLVELFDLVDLVTEREVANGVLSLVVPLPGRCESSVLTSAVSD